MPPRLSESGGREGAGGPPDAELVAAVRRGSEGAADRLVRRHFRAAYAVALAQLGRPMDAEDACQDAFVRALERIADCREPERFLFWLLQIVRNRARNLRARERVRGGPAVEDVPEPAARDDASAELGRAELRGRLATALGALPAVQREVVLLKDLEGWDHRAIAAALGLSEGMSRQHLFAARRALRGALASGEDRDDG